MQEQERDNVIPPPNGPTDPAHAESIHHEHYYLSTPSATLGHTTTTATTHRVDALYISSLALWGNVVRVYLGRLMGTDCEDGDLAPDDFGTHFFQRVCITAGGMTTQTGGAVFRDLPANLLGCFLMGILAATTTTTAAAMSSSPLPWLPKDHPLQLHRALHTGLGVGFCGCLTTFSSWNTQMVTMMVRTNRQFLVSLLVN
jgi:fluoride ion exporter CrcB/FEX